MTTQQRLLSDISHELRTPLTRLQLGTALLRRRSGEQEAGTYRNRSPASGQHDQRSAGDVAQSAENALVSETVKANQLWHEVLDNAAFEAEQMGKSFTVNFAGAMAAVR